VETTTRTTWINRRRFSRIARLNDEGAEGLSVRRTRVLLVPADSA